MTPDTNLLTLCLFLLFVLLVMLVSLLDDSHCQFQLSGVRQSGSQDPDERISQCRKQHVHYVCTSCINALHSGAFYGAIMDLATKTQYLGAEHNQKRRTPT